MKTGQKRWDSSDRVLMVGGKIVDVASRAWSDALGKWAPRVGTYKDTTLRGGVLAPWDPGAETERSWGRLPDLEPSSSFRLNCPWATGPDDGLAEALEGATAVMVVFGWHRDARVARNALALAGWDVLARPTWAASCDQTSPVAWSYAVASAELAADSRFADALRLADAKDGFCEDWRKHAAPAMERAWARASAPDAPAVPVCEDSFLSKGARPVFWSPGHIRTLFGLQSWGRVGETELYRRMGEGHIGGPTSYGPIVKALEARGAIEVGPGKGQRSLSDLGARFVQALSPSWADEDLPVRLRLWGQFGLAAAPEWKAYLTKRLADQDHLDRVAAAFQDESIGTP